MSELLLAFIFVTQLTVIFSTSPSIQKCKISDSACLKTSAQAATPILAAGMPEVGTESLDVMHVDNVKVDLAGLKLLVDNADLKGLKKAVIDKLSVDMAKKQMQVSWDTDITMKGHYKASGRLLILPISGDGDMTIKLKKLHIDMTIPFEVAKNAEGKDMIDLKSYKYIYDVKDNANFQLTNLFNGNKVLGDAMLKFMNDNWKVLSQEFGGPMLEKPNKKIFTAIKTYLASQPMENIVDYDTSV